ncbi:MAG TPA: HAD family phosphatase [Tepidisphaeraceae bacterium]|nr:HAD family phosphatase [Tepidisphaeraceae bacterium]
MNSDRLNDRNLLRIHAILFDFDGLMVDTEILYCQAAHALAKMYGTSVSDETLRRMTGVSRMTSMTVFVKECGIATATPEYLLEQREEIMSARYKQGVDPMPGLMAILDRFHGRLKLGMASNSSRRLVEIAINGLKIDRYLDAYQTGDDVINAKPDPEIYLKLMARLDVKPHECVVLEDSPMGAAAGKRAGAYVIAVPSPFTADADYSFTNARAGNLTEAAEMIERLLTGVVTRHEQH